MHNYISNRIATLFIHRVCCLQAREGYVEKDMERIEGKRILIMVLQSGKSIGLAALFQEVNINIVNAVASNPIVATNIVTV